MGFCILQMADRDFICHIDAQTCACQIQIVVVGALVVQRTRFNPLVNMIMVFAMAQYLIILICMGVHGIMQNMQNYLFRL